MKRDFYEYLKRHPDGVTAREVALDFEIGVATAREWLREAGVQPVKVRRKGLDGRERIQVGYRLR